MDKWLNKNLYVIIYFQLQGYPGLDGGKGEAGAAGAKVII